MKNDGDLNQDSFKGDREKWQMEDEILEQIFWYDLKVKNKEMGVINDYSLYIGRWQLIAEIGETMGRGVWERSPDRWVGSGTGVKILF